MCRLNKNRIKEKSALSTRSLSKSRASPKQSTDQKSKASNLIKRSSSKKPSSSQADLTKTKSKSKSKTQTKNISLTQSPSKKTKTKKEEEQEIEAKYPKINPLTTYVDRYPLDLTVFVTNTPGLEALLEQEIRLILDRFSSQILKKRQLQSYSLTRTEGGIELKHIHVEQMWLIICCSHLAENVRLRLGPAFPVKHFSQLERYLRLVPWNIAFPLRFPRDISFVPPLPTLSVTAIKSKLYHSGKSP
jgi:hypothetical protein